MKAMTPAAPGAFGAQLKTLRESAGFTQEELATIAGLSVHAISSLERGERRRPQTDTVRALSSALGLTDSDRAAFLSIARSLGQPAAESGHRPVLPAPATALLG